MKCYISSSSRNGYLYIFKHGIGPGTLPGDVEILKTKDLPNYYTAVWLDRFLTTDEMKQYDIPFETDIKYYLDRIGYCQKDGDVVPCDDVEACDAITASQRFEVIIKRYGEPAEEEVVTAESQQALEDKLNNDGYIDWWDYNSGKTYDPWETVNEDDHEFDYDDVEACDKVLASDEFDDEDKIYWIQAYYSKPHRGLADDFATNDWDAAIEKLVDFANDGYYVMFENLASGEGYEYDPDEVLEAIDFGDIYILRGLENLFEGQ